MSHVKLTKHPKGLWWLSLIYAAYAVSYGVLFANLLLYSIHSHTIIMSEQKAYAFFAAFGTLTFVLPLAGGILCDRFGFKQSAKIGLVTLIIGFILLALNMKFMLYIAIAFCLSGNALAMPAIWSMVGLIYNKHSQQRESGSILFYVIFNIGFLIAFSLSGIVADIIGYSAMYLIFGIGALISLYLLIIKDKDIVLVSSKTPTPTSQIFPLYIIVISLIIISFILTKFVILDNIVMWILAILAFIYLFSLTIQPKYKNDRQKIQAYMLLCIIAIIGITVYNSEFGLLPEFAYHSIDLTIGSWSLPPSIITSLDPVFCIILGYFLSYLWKRKKNVGIASKLSMGVILPAVGYICLSVALFAVGTSKLPMIILLPIFILFVIGELLVIPTGIAMSGKLAPIGKEGAFMGIWNVMQGFSALITGYIAYLTTLNTTHSTSQLNINHQYANVFLISGIIIFIAGVLTWLLRKYINRKVEA
ncbi:oligopeptide:H+ symporter [Cysteiniphilum halobium]|uniref:oligopeptide:H+ symporter n=1 Tax=Cysteiniphilum halobium TaxID=2219059 RepID=UPI000E65DEC6|nr:oligopeptide:H+ symporter [Cysteiniphilum halobium]